MSNWYYYSKTGEKIGPVSATSLKELARQGLITPETKVENQNGRAAAAGQINGLTFVETKQPETSVFGFDNGFNFPDLVSDGQTPDGFDPFANAAPAMPQVLSPAKSPSAFTKPIVLVPVSACGGMLLMLLMVLAFTTIFGSMEEMSHENSLNKSQESRQNKVQEVRKAKTENKSQPPRILLKEPHEKEAFVNKFSEETIAAMRKSLGDQYSNAYDSSYRPVFSASWDTAKTVYDIANSMKEEKDILKKMATLQYGYDICIENIATQWSRTLRSQYIGFHFSIVVSQVLSTYESNNCCHNLEQMKTDIKESIKKLDKRKYENTIKLFAILSQYEKAATEPSGSFASYTENRNACREEFTRTKSLAELEW